MSPPPLPPRPSTPLPDDTMLPLQPISASHDANHRANGAASSEEKTNFPTHDTASPSESSTAFSEPTDENPFSDCYEVPGANPFSDFYEVPGLFPKHPSAFDAEDERKMVWEYLDARSEETLWASTKYCGLTETVRQYHVPQSLHERLLSNMFGFGVNGAYAAMGGPGYFDLWGIYLEPDHQYRGARIAEVGDLHVLRTMQHFRALPYYNHDWLLEPTQAVRVPAGGETTGEVTEFGDPEAEEGAGEPEYDETETF
ncbi:hypothetical protein GSI_09526 [Ganoderma sinense ZZ0214-1]|uniref:Uncharacterized protein n=1 Tax=Ganoderma sinense ZZ0214-1 TaxID=1077348 RepID=A0A2G8S3R1_9APHY|nr:hypothetical protein GSI_09526 [Ganoderma sinense ZZ0214-1]